jgi:hypothetical protein
MTSRPFGSIVGTTPVSNMTGLPLFLSAALEDCRSLLQARTLRAEVLKVVRPGHAVDLRLEQQAVDVVCAVMGAAWRPSARWRQRLVAIGRHDLAAW